jgi:predicted ATPase/class 3 adenylate cyclase/DNA-binding CsgD family transcriptional regulator
MTTLPTGTVTFLFTDIEGSTRLLEAGQAAYRAALGRHDGIVRQAVAAHAGVIAQTRGDGFCAAFASPIAAALAALEAQRALLRERWETPAPLKARMAVHTGAVELHGDEYFGAPLHRSARLLDSAHGGQIVLSAATAALVGETPPPEIDLRDLGEHRLRDLARPERVFQLCGAGLPSEFPPLRTLTASPNNLPVQATAFIGREQQLQSVRETVLRPDTRLLTLTGPGGTGKTRLGLQAAGDLLDAFADGVYVVHLASVTAPDLVASSIAQALDVRETSGRAMVRALTDFLRQKRLLLVLDNFEQVLEAATLVAELLGAASGLKALVTSRSPLRIYGEREYPVPPLALPDRRTMPTAAHLAQFEAVRLFEDRAQAARPDFAVDDTNAADVAEICHRLDGLPLAIELAAARIRALPPSALLQRMARRLPLLTGGARDLPARQRTLRDAIAWSYDLLEPDEQALFRRLAVFRGCTLDAAESVCAGEAPRPGATSVALPPLDIEVLDGVESLVEKSLLRQEQTPDGQPWYVLLETVREYALERLEQSSEAGAAHRRHALTSVRLAERSEPELYGPDQSRWLALMEHEHANLRAALDWCQEHGYAEPALRLGVALWWFWSISGHVKEGRERLESLLARFPLKSGASGTRVERQARALLGAGMLASIQGDDVAARSLQEAGLALRRTMPDLMGLFSALEGVGTVACLQGDYAAARRYFEEALAVARQLGDRTSYANVMTLLGNVSYELGDLDVARAYYDEGLIAFSESESQTYRWLNSAMLGVAAVALEQGHYQDAQRLAYEALAGTEKTKQTNLHAFVLAILGAIALARGDLGTTREHLANGIRICQQIGNVAAVAQILERFVGLAAAQERYEGALCLAAASAALHERAASPLSPRGQGRLDRALESARRALGKEAADRAWQTGSLLDVDAAVAAALAITDLALPKDVSTAGTTPTSASGAVPASGAVSVLTRREQEVAVLIARGLTNRQIAEALVITEGTAANHVVHILNKLGYSSRAQIAVWTSGHGLL